MRIFITGGEGQLGRALLPRIAAGDAIAPAEREIDITDRSATVAAIATAAPAVVIHSAALTDTARCERNPKAAHAVNALGTANVAAGAARAGARLVVISTNEVFAGDQSHPYDEGDAPHPRNEYAISKLEGERRARSACPDTLVVRTAWLYGGGDNFVERVLRLAAGGGALRFVTDEVATPTSAGDLAAAILALVEAAAPAGVYHLTNAGEASRYDWATAILRLAGDDPGRIERVTAAALRRDGYDGPRKPAYSVLANTRAAALGVTLRPWREALAEYMATRPKAASDA